MGDIRCIMRLAVGFIAMLFVLGACSGGSDDESAVSDDDVAAQQDDAPDVDSDPPTTTAIEPIEFDAATAPVITVLDQGAEPRQELRFDLNDGAEETMTVSLQVIEQLVDGEAIVEPQPIETFTEVTVTRRVTDRGVEVASEITDVQLGPGTDAALGEFIGANFEALIGITTTVLVDDRGIITGTTADGGSGELVDDLLGDAINQSTPLPEEPIGVGGSWVSETSVEENGITVIMQTTSTVREFTDTGVVLDIEVVQDIAELGEEINLDGAVAIVDIWDVSGGGSTELNLTQFSPVLLELAIDGSQGFSFPGAGSLEQRLTVETTIETVG